MSEPLDHRLAPSFDNADSTGISQAQHRGDFVEGFTSRIVDRSAKQLKRHCVATIEQVGMSATNDKAQTRKHFFSGGDAAGIDVSMKMIDRHQRLVPIPSQSLCCDHPTSNEPAKPGCVATAIAARSGPLTLACSRACSITGMIRCRCARAAISGTTPWYFECSSSCEATTELSTVKSSRITAAAVSSQVDSIVSNSFAIPLFSASRLRPIREMLDFPDILSDAILPLAVRFWAGSQMLSEKPWNVAE